MSNRGFDILCVLSALAVVPWVVGLSPLAIVWTLGSTGFFFAARSMARDAPPSSGLPLQLVCAGATGILTFAMFLGFLWPSFHTLIAIVLAIPLLLSILGIFRPGILLERPFLPALVCAAVAFAVVGEFIQMGWLYFA